MKQILPLALIILLHCACNSTKPVEQLSSQQDTLKVEPTLWQKLTGAGKVKVNNSTIIIASNSQVDATNTGKAKGSTQNRNDQNASCGSTIGAASFEGADHSKTKESAVSKAKSDNTAGQGAKQEVRQSAEAKSTVDKGGIKLWMVGLGLLLVAAYWGYGKYRKTYKPWEWIG